ncbi:MAG: hypothetical protein R3D43_02795 [Tepidamorphaceae bacterium]
MLSVAVGTCNAFLFERYDFRLQGPALRADAAAAGDPRHHSRHSILVASNFLANTLKT